MSRDLIPKCVINIYIDIRNIFVNRKKGCGFKESHLKNLMSLSKESTKIILQF